MGKWDKMEERKVIMGNRRENGGENEGDNGGVRGNEEEKGGKEEGEGKTREKSRGIGKEVGRGIEIGEGERTEESRSLKEKVRKVEEMWERRDRKERRRNVVIKRCETGGEGAKTKILERIKRVGMEVGVEEVREVRTRREEQHGFAVVRFRTEKEKREVMRKKED